jgi:hypothetical protein
LRGMRRMIWGGDGETRSEFIGSGDVQMARPCFYPPKIRHVVSELKWPGPDSEVAPAIPKKM